MLTFDTPGPISVTTDLTIGEVKIVATDRIDTVIDVSPRDSTKKADVDAAEQTRVDFAESRLWVKASNERSPRHVLFGRRGAVDVRIDLPTGSHLRGSALSASFRAEGQLGECLIRNVDGDISLDRTGSMHLHTSAGNVTVGKAMGTILVAVGHGSMTIDQVHGTAVIKMINGATRVGVARGDLRLKTANGNVSVASSFGAVEVKVANGDIRVAELVCGSMVLETGTGAVDVGVRKGTTARIDLRTRYGNVTNLLTARNGGASASEIGTVRARVSYGDIIIRRSS